MRWCKRLTEFGYPPKITTNGSLIHKHDLEELVRNTTVIHFSMHGGPDPEGRERYMPGLDHEQCLQNFRDVGSTIKRLGAATQLWASDMFCSPEEAESKERRWTELASCDTFEFRKTVPFQRTEFVDSGKRFGPRIICRSYGPHVLGGILWDGTIEDLFNNEKALRFRAEALGKLELGEDHICRRCYTVKELP